MNYKTSCLKIICWHVVRSGTEISGVPVRRNGNSYIRTSMAGVSIRMKVHGIFNRRSGKRYEIQDFVASAQPMGKAPQAKFFPVDGTNGFRGCEEVGRAMKRANALEDIVLRTECHDNQLCPGRGLLDASPVMLKIDCPPSRFKRRVSSIPFISNSRLYPLNLSLSKVWGSRQRPASCFVPSPWRLFGEGDGIGRRHFNPFDDDRFSAPRFQCGAVFLSLL